MRWLFPIQNVDLKIDGETLIYVKGTKTKEIDLGAVSSVSPSHDQLGWKIVMRGDAGQHAGIVFDFNAGSTRPQI